MEYYVFETEGQAQACLDYINNSDWFPIAGTNGSIGTTKWAEAIQELPDGRFAFPRIPSNRLDFIGVSVQSREAFLHAFNPSIEALTIEALTIKELNLEDEL